MLIIFAHAIFNVIISANGEEWKIYGASWPRLLGFISSSITDEFRMSLCHVYSLVIQLFGALIAISDIYWSKFKPVLSRYPTLQHVLVSFEENGNLETGFKFSANLQFFYFWMHLQSVENLNMSGHKHKLNLLLR